MNTNIDIENLLTGLKKGDKSSLSKCLTLIESQKADDNQAAIQLLKGAQLSQNSSARIGITGPPGVGKSSFIEKIGLEFIKNGKKVAVLTIDPSSSVTKGSILADKTRMIELSKNASAFIRPTAAGDHLGGVSTATHDSIMLCESAGYDVIIVETVGVGQSETDVSLLVDMTIVMALPGAGDDLQGIKKGLMEHADLFIVHKFDGDLEKKALKTAEILKSILQFLPKNTAKPEKKVLLCSSLESKNVDQCTQEIQFYFDHIIKNNYLYINRNKQIEYLFPQLCEKYFWQSAMEIKELRNAFDNIVNKLKSEEISAREGLYLLINDIFAILKSE